MILLIFISYVQYLFELLSWEFAFQVILFNLSSVTPTQVNGNNITDPTYLKHGDVLTIIDRSFRWVPIVCTNSYGTVRIVFWYWYLFRRVKEKKQSGLPFKH